MNDPHAAGYAWADAHANCSHAYLLPAVTQALERKSFAQLPRRVFDLGCGNGAVASHLAARGWEVAGVDPSRQGIAQANAAYPSVRLEVGSTDDDLPARFGTFPFVISLEVVEHVYAPRAYAARLFSLVQPGGVALVSTPYHGYLKNLALAASGRMDDHFTALLDHGHIKFWSRRTLAVLLGEAGFRELEFMRLGRIPPLAKSMLAVMQRP